MTGAPGSVEPGQLAELHLRLAAEKGGGDAADEDGGG
jgi:hypothetical protein